MADIVFHKPIPGFEGYTASHEGKIYSWKKGRVSELSIGKTGTGYATHSPKRTTEKKNETCSTHRLVALAWLANPKNLPQVNHKDTNKKNNCVDNLEWSTSQDNAIHARKNGKGIKGRKVCQLDKMGKVIKEYKSIKTASEKSGIHNRTISQVCVAIGGVRTDGYRAGRKTAGGFGWCYKEDLGKLKGGVHGCSKTVDQYTTDGVFVKSFSSLNDAAKAVGKSHGGISNVCTGKQKTAGGFIWKYGTQKVVLKSKIEVESKKWVVLKRFPGHKVSKDGRIYSISYRRILEGAKRPDGRKYVTIADKTGKLITIAVYRLVAHAYLPNPNKYKKVNHLDHDPSNDKVENLEWCNHSRDAQHTYDMELHKKARPILQIQGNAIVKRYKSAGEACRLLKFPSGALSNVLHGRSQTYKGFKWQYEEQ